MKENLLDDLLIGLAARESSDTVFNQYEDPTIINNLRVYLEYLQEEFSQEDNPRIFLVGEAPGYNGCRLTGIPFTSGILIRKARHKIFRKIGRYIHLKQTRSEATATIFWEFFEDHYPLPLLWNSFPFHPHESKEQESNRKPTTVERKEGITYLLTLCDTFRPWVICALGRVAEITLKELFPFDEVTYIRHPSRGGKIEFLKGMKTVFKTKKKRPELTAYL